MASFRNIGEKIKIKSYDELFNSTEPGRNAEGGICEIPLTEIDAFPGHPFKVLLNEDMEQLVESIRENGVMTPATVRKKADGRYELISGHRRKKACELAGLTTLRCEVKELDDDDAVIAMVESNLQRTEVLPSEKAFAYKMRLEAMKRQGQRTDLTSSPLGTKLRASDELAQECGDSRNQIHRYIRLTELLPELLQMVDEKKLALRPAVTLSYLSPEAQADVQRAISLTRIYPSIEQSQKMRDVAGDSGLSYEAALAILLDRKQEKSTIRDRRITALIPESVPKGSEAEYVIRAIQFYQEHRPAEDEEL